MRIISGQFKGKKLNAPKNLPVRPTTDMAKEALFNILNNRYYFDEIRVCDLFSGTGGISYEFASRGTEDITSVDQHAGCVQYINKTAKLLGKEINVVKSDVFHFLDSVHSKYDVVFADPPYESSEAFFSNLVNKVFEKGLLNDNGLLIIEHSSRTDLSKLENYTEQKKYGGNCFSFFSMG